MPWKSASLGSVIFLFVTCASAADRLPDDFPELEFMDAHPLAITPATAVSRAKKSGCGVASADMSSLGLQTGLITRPSSADQLYIDRGALSDGTRWAALRKHSDPSMAYCGFVATPDGDGSNVFVFGVTQDNELRAVRAVRSGELFCHCRQFSQ